MEVGKIETRCGMCSRKSKWQMEARPQVKQALAQLGRPRPPAGTVVKQF